MCGGVARWLRVFGIDTTWTPGIDDDLLVREAQAENRIVVTCDGKLLERRVFTTGEIGSVRVPVGLRLREQVHFVASELKIRPGQPRCTACNGTLAPVERREVADVVPARSLIWVRSFWRCTACQQVFWEGSHWRNIRRQCEQLSR